MRMRERPVVVTEVGAVPSGVVELEGHCVTECARHGGLCENVCEEDTLTEKSDIDLVSAKVDGEGGRPIHLCDGELYFNPSSFWATQCSIC